MTTTRALLLSALVLASAALALVAYVVAASRHMKASRRMPRLVGRVATVERALDPEGFVMMDGEIWRARLREGVAGARESVVVVGARDYVLEVERRDRAGL